LSRTLALGRRVVDPVVDAAALERVVDLAGAVGGDHGHRPVARGDRPQLGDGDLEVAQEFQQEALELLVGAIDLVDQQHRRPLEARVDRLEQRPLEQELLGEDPLGAALVAVGAGRPIGRPRLDLEELPRVVPLVDRLVDVEPLVALEPDQPGVERSRQDLRDLGLAHPRLTLEKQRPPHLEGEEDARGEAGVGDVVVPSEGGGGVVDRVQHYHLA
jgi:hypothetical protein